MCLTMTESSFLYEKTYQAYHHFGEVSLSFLFNCYIRHMDLEISQLLYSLEKCLWSTSREMKECQLCQCLHVSHISKESHCFKWFIPWMRKSSDKGVRNMVTRVPLSSRTMAGWELTPLPHDLVQLQSQKLGQPHPDSACTAASALETLK